MYKFDAVYYQVLVKHMYKAVYVPNMLKKIDCDILILICIAIVQIFAQTRECDHRTEVGVEPILSYMALLLCVLIVTAYTVVILASLFFNQVYLFCEYHPVCFRFRGSNTHKACT